jgi:hypothetical protein
MAAQVLILIFIHHIFILRETKLGIEGWFGWFLFFNAKCNTISVISWWSVLLVVEPQYLQKTTDLSQDFIT